MPREAERGDVTQDQARLPVTSNMGVACRREFVPVTTGGDTLKAAVHPGPAHWRHAELGQDAPTIKHGGRFRQSGQHQLEERLVCEGVEAEYLPSPLDSLDQQR